MENKEFISTTELAKILGISRMAVFKKIKSGAIKAKKVGRNFMISKKELPVVLGNVVSKEQKSDINQAVKKAIHQYGETFRLLGRE